MKGGKRQERILQRQGGAVTHALTLLAQAPSLSRWPEQLPVSEHFHNGTLCLVLSTAV